MDTLQRVLRLRTCLTKRKSNHHDLEASFKKFGFKKLEATPPFMTALSFDGAVALLAAGAAVGAEVVVVTPVALHTQSSTDV
jgi:hypothetical protein